MNHQKFHILKLNNTLQQSIGIKIIFIFFKQDYDIENPISARIAKALKVEEMENPDKEDH